LINKALSMCKKGLTVSSQESHPPKSFKDTLNLPHTEFPIRADAKVEDPALLQRWISENLFRLAFEHNKGAQKFILHDGPPYANGPIHLGHAYNKILKDIVCKSRRMSGYHVPVTPGWDCHGLPIELKVAQEKPGLAPVEFMQACREYARKWIDVQRNSFKQLGVLMDWDRPYITMAPAYEATIVRAFGKLVKEGFIERKNKTVPWCPTDQTVLATAEIEYKDRKDPSIYVLFQLTQDAQQAIFSHLAESVSLLVWTTTPWTLPLNKAVILKPHAAYQVLRIKNKLVLVGAQTADKLCALMNVEKDIVADCNADIFTGQWAQHPFIDQKTPILFDDSVGLEEGTACVHSAPGCGPIDYEIGVKNNLEIYSPITPDGKYSSEIKPIELAGMPVIDGQIWVIKKLAELEKLLFKNNITHSYPHCWRCHNGLIFRATPQWFFDLDKHKVKQQALAAIEQINFIPTQGRNFLKATVEHRWEWCLSRQRVWGAPIPALLCSKCDYAYTDQLFIDKIAQGIEKDGIEFWYNVDLNQVLPSGFACPQCKSTEWKKEFDILDVWFDAGVSHYAVLYNNPELKFPADIYLEGVDQHRGWFQSSLLTSLVLEQKACTQAIMTHGYTVDAKGQKMSKSLGNVVAPEDIIKQLGTDGLRLWVASVGYDKDPSVSDVLLRNIAEVYRKIRNTCRFLLSNLADFNYETDHIASEQLLPFDRYALVQLYYVNQTVQKSYEAFDFTEVFHGLADYCSVELSSFYLDISKDRLYVEQATGIKRRSAQTVYWHILNTLTRLMAPIMSFTAEQISDFSQKDKKRSIHLQDFVTSQALHDLCWPHTANTPDESVYKQQWEEIKQIRSLILKAIEIEREKGVIKHSLEAQVQISIDFESKRYSILKPFLAHLDAQTYLFEEFLKELVIVSKVQLLPASGNLSKTTDGAIQITVTHAQGTKCPRCWQWDVSIDPDGLCTRCQRVLGRIP
jgi:isoleucyl-tRNA synthetase